MVVADETEPVERLPCICEEIEKARSWSKRTLNVKDRVVEPCGSSLRGSLCDQSKADMKQLKTGWGEWAPTM